MIYLTHHCGQNTLKIFQAYRHFLLLQFVSHYQTPCVTKGVADNFTRVGDSLPRSYFCPIMAAVAQAIKNLALPVPLLSTAKYHNKLLKWNSSNNTEVKKCPTSDCRLFPPPQTAARKAFDTLLHG